MGPGDNEREWRNYALGFRGLEDGILDVMTRGTLPCTGLYFQGVHSAEVICRKSLIYRTRGRPDRANHEVRGASD